MKNKSLLIVFSIFFCCFIGCGNMESDKGSESNLDTVTAMAEIADTSYVPPESTVAPAPAGDSAMPPAAPSLQQPTSATVAPAPITNDTLNLSIPLSEIDKEGVVLWDLPEYMTVGESSIVNVRIAISGKENIKSIMIGVDTTSANSGMKPIEISKKMLVTLLVDDPTDITIRSFDSVHVIPNSEYAQWTWSVIPRKAKKQYLILRVSKIDSMNEAKEVFSKEFEVKATAVYRAMQIWNFIKEQWIPISAIITFFAGLFIRNKVKR